MRDFTQPCTATLEFSGFLSALKKHRYCIVMKDDSGKLIINKNLVFFSPFVLFNSNIYMKHDFLVLVKKNHDGLSQWPPQRKNLTP